MPKLSLQQWASLVIISAGGIGVLYVLVKYTFPALLPFLLAWGAAFLLRPVSCALEAKWHIPRRIGAVVLNLISVALMFFLVFYLSKQLFEEGQSLLVWLEEHPESINGFFEDINGFLTRFRFFLPHASNDVSGTDMPNMVENLLRSGIETLVGRLPQIIGSWLKRLPGVLLFVSVTLIASVYFALHLEGINRKVLGVLPPKIANTLKKLKAGMFHTGLAYLRAYLLLMGMTFLLLLLGFLLFRIPYALLLAFLFALVDILPILGVGTTLVPWGLFCLAVGQTVRGVELLVLYGVILLVRQFAEPRIVGARLGIPPLLMLVYLYAGLVIFGFWGIFVGPLVGTLLRSLVQYGAEENASENEAEKS